MSQSCGACGAYGLLISEFNKPEFHCVQSVLQRLEAYLEKKRDDGTFYDYNYPDDFPSIPRFAKEFSAAFAKHGILTPKRLFLLWTGSEDSRPAGVESRPWRAPRGLHTDNL